MAYEGWIVEEGSNEIGQFDLVALKSMDLTGKKVRPVGSWTYLTEQDIRTLISGESAIKFDPSGPAIEPIAGEFQVIEDAPIVFESNKPPLQQNVVAPPSMTIPPSVASYPRSGDQPPALTDDPMRFLIPVNPSGWAIAAGYLGLFSVLCVFAPLALIAGFLGLQDIKKNPQKTGKGRAWFGVVMGTLGTVFLIIIALGSLKK